jgi:ArsR family transcriptional regulator
VSGTKPKQAIYASLAEVAQALGHAHRLELLEHLAQRVHSVDELSTRTGLTFANTSRHLQILRRARLVETERSGKNILYRLAGDAEVVALTSALGRVGERNIAEIGRVMADYFSARDALDPVSKDELIELLHEDLVTVLDVRPEDEFEVGHLPGALNIPVAELERRLGELPVNQEVIAYCRGPYCVFSVNAVSMLRSRGYQVRRLEDGYPEWKAAGLPIEGTVDRDMDGTSGNVQH